MKGKWAMLVGCAGLLAAAVVGYVLEGQTNPLLPIRAGSADFASYGAPADDDEGAAAMAVAIGIWVVLAGVCLLGGAMLLRWRACSDNQVIYVRMEIPPVRRVRRSRRRVRLRQAGGPSPRRHADAGGAPGRPPN